MGDIPGLTSLGTIPRLGQGIAGGRGSVVGLPGGPEASAIPGLPTLSAIPRVQVPQTNVAPLPAPALDTPGTVFQDSGALAHTKLRLDQARQILLQVRTGRLDPLKAMKLLDDLTPNERRVLTKAVLTDHAANGGPPPTSELQALRYLPVGKDPGMSSGGTDPTRGTGIGSNIAMDAFNTVVGMPAGIGLLGVNVGKDIGELAQGKPQKATNTYEKVLKPIGESYANTYGSALHGNFQPIEQHPLGPALDALSVASAGIGTAARLGDVADVLRAGKISEFTPMYHGAEEGVSRESLSSQFGRLDDTSGPGLYASSSKPVANAYAEFAGGKTHAISFGKNKLIDADTPIESLPRALQKDLKPITDEMPSGRTTVGHLLTEVASIEDQPMMDQLHQILSKHGYVGAHYRAWTTEDDLANFGDHVPADVLDKAIGDVGQSREAVIWGQKGLQEALKNPKGAVAEVGGQYRIHEHAPKTATGDALGLNRIGPETPLDDSMKQAIIRAAQTVGARHPSEYAQEFVNGVTKDLTKEPEYQAYIAHDIPGTEGDVIGDFPILDQLNKAFSEAVGRGADDAGTGFGEGEHRWFFNDKAEAEAAAQKLNQIAKEYGLTQGDEPAIADVIPEQPETLGEVVGGVADRGKDLEPKTRETHPKMSDEGLRIANQVNAKWAESQPFFHEFLDELTKNLHARGYRADDLIGNYSRQPSDLHPNTLAALERLKPEKITRSLPQRYSVREQGKIVGQNFPTKEAAIKHAQSLITPYKSSLEAFVKGGGSRGRLLDRYEEARGFNHEAEIQNLMGEVADVLDKPNLRVNRRTMKQVAQEVWGDIKQTRVEGKNRPAQIAADNPGFFDNRALAKGLSTGETALREASDLVRAGAIYLRPAYLPNNWVGNAFMSATHQGVLAPVNLAKSLVVDKYIGKKYTAAMDKVMGQNAAEVVTAPRGRGYVASLTNPLAHSMGALADQPFRRAAFLHEARRAGYSKLTDVQKLFDRAAGKDEDALREIATIGRKAQEEIVKFGHMNEMERSVVRNLIFVYSWMRGAGRYAARYPLQHPIQALANYHLSNDVGNPYLAKEVGGVPTYLAGAVPVGHDSKGNPILVNPFNLNPLGTAVDIGRAIAGTAKVLHDPKHFNKYVDSDIAGLTNPLIQSYLNAREGGKPVKQQLERTLAPVRLAQELQHPGTGSVFPTSRVEALGNYTLGSIFPRVADQQELTKSLEQEQRNDPVARIPTDMKTFKKLTGQDMPQSLVGAYKGDLEQVQMLKDFQSHYASQHGQSGFRNLPPANKVDAAIKFLIQHKFATPAEALEYQREAAQIHDDGNLNSFANSLFSSTGIGQYKQAWDGLMRDAKNQQLTRKR